MSPAVKKPRTRIELSTGRIVRVAESSETVKRRLDGLLINGWFNVTEIYGDWDQSYRTVTIYEKLVSISPTDGEPNTG